MSLYTQLTQLVGTENVFENEPLKYHTSFKIGGPADYYITPENEQHIRELLIFAKKEKKPVFIMGNGSNLLVRDKGIRGIVISVGEKMSKVTLEENLVHAESGILLSALAKIILDQSLEGFEFASGIPGTLGGGVSMNAGAYDGELKDIVHSVRIMDMDGNIKEMSLEDMQFGYRRSYLTANPGIVLSATLKLKPGKYQDIKAKIDDFTIRRTTKQPLAAYSAGSTFKRPVGHYASQLIQEAGLKGIVMNQAAVSDLHSGFVINKKEATCENVLELIEFIKATVYDKFQVMLEEEVKIVGEQ